MRMKDNLAADAALLLLTLLWGTSFPVTKIAMRDAGVFTFLCQRFLMGSVFLLPFVLKTANQLMVNNGDRSGRLWWLFHPKYYSSMKSLKSAGFILGCWMFLGFLLQTLGMKFTSASKSGFLTGTLVVMVPFLAAIFLKSTIRLRHILAALLSMTGIFLLTRPDTFDINIGDLMTLGCAFSFAMQMIFVHKYSNRENSVILAFFQVFAVGILAVPLALILEGFRGILIPQIWLLALWNAIFCTAVAFWIQCRFQPITKAQSAAVIYSMEPVFAAVSAFILLGEKQLNLPGAMAIMVAMIIAEWHHNHR